MLNERSRPQKYTSPLVNDNASSAAVPDTLPFLRAGKPFPMVDFKMSSEVPSPYKRGTTLWSASREAKHPLSPLKARGTAFPFKAKDMCFFAQYPPSVEMQRSG